MPKAIVVSSAKMTDLVQLLRSLVHGGIEFIIIGGEERIIGSAAAPDKGTRAIRLIETPT